MLFWSLTRLHISERRRHFEWGRDGVDEASPSSKFQFLFSFKCFGLLIAGIWLIKNINSASSVFIPHSLTHSFTKNLIFIEPWMQANRYFFQLVGLPSSLGIMNTHSLLARTRFSEDLDRHLDTSWCVQVQWAIKSQDSNLQFPLREGERERVGLDSVDE